MIADKIEIFAETSLMILLLVYLFFLMSLLNPMTMLKYFYYFVGCIVNFIVSYLICMFQDSVPTGSYNDPFLSSVCVCACARFAAAGITLFQRSFSVQSLTLATSTWMPAFSRLSFSSSVGDAVNTTFAGLNNLQAPIETAPNSSRFTLGE